MVTRRTRRRLLPGQKRVPPRLTEKLVEEKEGTLSRQTEEIKRSFNFPDPLGGKLKDLLIFPTESVGVSVDWEFDLARAGRILPRKTPIRRQVYFVTILYYLL